MGMSTNHRSVPTTPLSLSATVLFGLTLTLSGCGDDLAGSKYVEENGKEGIEFKSDDKAYLTIMGSTVEAEYSVDDDKIIVRAGGQGMVLTRADDGTITGLPMSGKLKKKEE